MTKWQMWSTLDKFPVRREVNKWTQLFDVAVIFVHMDLSAASESIVIAHLNHCQLLLPRLKRFRSCSEIRGCLE